MALQTSVEMLLILALILANGFFAAAEIALIAARRGRLQQMADEGDVAAKTALELSKSPNYFLPTVQIGITIVGTLAAVFGGARVVAGLREFLDSLGIEWITQSSYAISMAVVVLVISLLQVLFGELVPKRLAIRDPSSLARFVAFPIRGMVWLLRPVLLVVDGTLNATMKLFGMHGESEQQLRREDIEQLLDEGLTGGLLNPVERRVAAEALRLSDRTVKDVMQPRVEVDGMDVNTPHDEVLGTVAMAGFSRLPVYEGDLDHIIGFVHVKDVLRQVHLGWPLDLKKLLRPALFVPETLPLDKLLVNFKEQRTHLAVVLDEFGGTEGIVTLDAVLGDLVGEIFDEHTRDRSQIIVRRDDSSWLVDGLANVDDLLEQMEIKKIKLPSPRTFTTIAGLVHEVLGRLPRVGETLNWEGLRIEVVDMDGPRIDRLLVYDTEARQTAPAEEQTKVEG